MINGLIEETELRESSKELELQGLDSSFSAVLSEQAHKNIEPSKALRKTVSYDYVDIDCITKNHNITDYSLSEEVKHPRVIKCDDQYYEIDNYGQVENAKERGESSIYCEIVEMEKIDILSWSIYKVSSRIRTPGGYVEYKQKVKAVKDLANLIRESGQEYVEYEHGGLRRRELTKNRDVDLRHILSESLNLSRDAISKLMNYGKYLNDHILNYEGLTKQHFEAFQIEKKSLCQQLENKKYGHDVITEQVSAKFEEFLDRMTKDERVSEDSSEKGKSDQEFREYLKQLKSFLNQNSQHNDNNENDLNLYEIDQHESSSVDEDAEEPIDVNEIVRKLLQFSSVRIDEKPGSNPSTLNNEIKKCGFHIMQISSKDLSDPKKCYEAKEGLRSYRQILDLIINKMNKANEENSNSTVSTE